jgi:hypothetical protein
MLTFCCIALKPDVSMKDFLIHFSSGGALRNGRCSPGDRDLHVCGTCVAAQPGRVDAAVVDHRDQAAEPLLELADGRRQSADA